MGTDSPDRGREEAVRLQAADWFARLRAPDGETDQAEFEAWLSADPEHAAAFDRLGRRWDQTAFLANTELGRSRGLVRRPFGSFTGRWRYAAAAAAALVALLGTGIVWRGNQAADERGVPAAQQYATDEGRRRTIELPDGSTALLDGNSALEVAYSADRRVLSLSRGRARFSVARDSARPFEVSAGAAIVIARGTVFDVAIAGEGRVRVALLEGSVEVRSRLRSGSVKAAERPRILAPGQEVVVSPGGPPADPVAARPAGTSRAPDMLSFDAAPLDRAVAEINRYSRMKIRLGNTDLASLRVTGAFRTGDIDEFAAAISSAFDLGVRRAPDGTIVLVRLEP